MIKLNPYFTNKEVYTRGNVDFTEAEWELQFRSQFETYKEAEASGLFDKDELEEMLAETNK